MKRIQKPALFFLVIGLLLTSLTPIMDRYIPIPGMIKGFITGLGLAFEIIALVKLDQNRKCKSRA